MIAAVIIVIDEAGDRAFEIAGQIVVSARVAHTLVFEPVGKLAGAQPVTFRYVKSVCQSWLMAVDVGRPVIGEQPWPSLEIGVIQPM